MLSASALVKLFVRNHISSRVGLDRNGFPAGRSVWSDFLWVSAGVSQNGPTYSSDPAMAAQTGRLLIDTSTRL